MNNNRSQEGRQTTLGINLHPAREPPIFESQYTEYIPPDRNGFREITGKYSESEFQVGHSRELKESLKYEKGNNPES